MWWAYAFGFLFSVGFWGYDLRHEGWWQKYLLTFFFALIWPIIMPILMGATLRGWSEGS